MESHTTDFISLYQKNNISLCENRKDENFNDFADYSLIQPNSQFLNKFEYSNKITDQIFMKRRIP